MDNPITRQVKINDMTDNMTIKHLHKLNNDELERKNKFLSTFHELTT